MTDTYSFFAFTDIFEEMQTSSTPFHGCFGLLNIDGIPKPTYRAFQILHSTGTDRIPVAISESPTLEVLAVKKDTEKLTIIAFNHNIPLSPIKDEEAMLIVTGITDIKAATLQRVDEEHCNPRKQWIEMGSPEYLRKEQLQQLMEAAELKTESIKSENTSEGVVFHVTVPPHGIAAITINL